MDGKLGITAPINQRCALDNLMHFSSVVLAAWHARSRSVGTKFAINLSCLSPPSLATSSEPSSYFIQKPVWIPRAFQPVNALKIHLYGLVAQPCSISASQDEKQFYLVC